jgi:fatty-acid desaturase
MVIAVPILVYLVTFYVVLTATSIGYHRALCHGAVKLHPAARWLLTNVGVWFTAIDAKTWVVMHRKHHLHSDTPDDPHSPKYVGFRGMLLAQIRGYNGTVDALRAKQEPFASLGADLELSWPTRHGLWFAPYLVHFALGTVVALTVGWPIAVALLAGLWSHALQGATINSFGHAVGGRNFDTPDDSRNNHPSAWVLFGEGFQNNHHRYPASARFSARAGEWDPGWLVCRTLEKVGALTIARDTLIPTDTPPSEGATASQS